MTDYKQPTITLLILISFLSAQAQNNSITDSLSKTVNIKQNKYVLGFLPSKAHNIYGLAIGLIGSEAICYKPYTKYSHGINLQIPGQGILQIPYLFGQPFSKEFQSGNIDMMIKIDSNKRVVHNGLLISVFGTFSDQVNGISFSGLMSMGKKINGITLNPVWNLYQRVHGMSVGVINTSLETKGVQFGLINKTVKLKGFQIGLWNRNDERSLPIINWNFKTTE